MHITYHVPDTGLQCQRCNGQQDILIPILTESKVLQRHAPENRYSQFSAAKEKVQGPLGTNRRDGSQDIFVGYEDAGQERFSGRNNI